MKTLISLATFSLFVLASTPTWAQAGTAPAQTAPAATPQQGQEPAAPTAAPVEAPPVVEEPFQAPPDPGRQPGVIAGSVRSIGGGYPGGTVTVKNKTTGETKTTQATAISGEYKFEGLAPGAYDLTVDTPDFTVTGGSVEPGGGSIDLAVRPLMGWEPLLPVFSWLHRTPLGVSVRESTWAVAYLEVVHLLGLTVLLGSSVAVGLRVSNIAMRSLPAAEVAREVRPYMLGGLVVMLVTGIPILASEAEKMFQSGPFEMKMLFFVLSNIFQFGIVGLMARSKNDPHPVAGKVAALISVVLWYVVAWEGRAIAFF